MADNLPIRIFVNKTEDRITFRTKMEYHLQVLMPEMMKLLGCTKSKISKDENGTNAPCLEITEVVLVHCNNANNDYQDSNTLYAFVPNKSFGQLLDISPT